MNDTDRAQWIDNEEGLYRWWKQHRQSKQAFIRANRAEIDAKIRRFKRGEETADLNHRPRDRTIERPNPRKPPAP